MSTIKGAHKVLEYGDFGLWVTYVTHSSVTVTSLARWYHLFPSVELYCTGACFHTYHHPQQMNLHYHKVNDFKERIVQFSSVEECK